MDAISITGIGVISSLGIGREAFWEGCRQSTSGIHRITTFDPSPYRSNVAAWIADFRPSDFMPPMTYRRMSRISRMAVAASIEAVADCGLDFKTMDRDRVAVIVGTAYGSSSHVEDFYCSLLADGPRGAQPFLFPDTVPNAPASHIAIYHKVKGPNATFCQNEISAETGIAYARSLLEQNLVDVVLVGGAEELSEILFRCYDAVGGLNPVWRTDNRAIHPEPGQGLILGEGAAILVLERRGAARQRGAKIYGNLVADVIAGGPSEMGHYPRDGQPMKRTLEIAMARAGLRPEDIDHIGASANFARELDGVEFELIKSVFQGDQKKICVSPLKYLIGDFGAAGTTRAAAVLLGMYHQLSPPEIRLSTLMNQGNKPLKWEPGRHRRIDHALMLSATFGGGAASLIFSKEN